jgi:hypothetical protein
VYDDVHEMHIQMMRERERERELTDDDGRQHPDDGRSLESLSP